MYTENEIKAPNGIMMIAALLIAQLAAVGLILTLGRAGGLFAILTVLVAIVVFICWFGFFMVNPNEAKILQLFGKYVGTVKNEAYDGLIRFMLKKQSL